MLKNLFIYVLLIAAACIGILYYLLTDKYNKQNLQVRVLTKQINGLNAQLGALNKAFENIKIYYHPISFDTGETLRKCSLYISPLSNSPIIRTILPGTKVQIIDSVETLEILWYEVKVLCSETTNIKGFIRQEYVKGLQVVTTNIVSSKYY